MNKTSGLLNFKVSHVAQACMLVLMSQMVANVAQAGPGWADSIDKAGNAMRVPTYYATSPFGQRRATSITNDKGIDVLQAVGNNGYSGKALRKFVDPLPVAGEANAKLLADGSASKYLPLAVPEKWIRPDGSLSADDYYEVAVVEYTEKMHSDLRKATTLRGYVQLATARNPGKHIPLKDPKGNPLMIQKTDANGKLVFSANGKAPVMVQAYAYDNPHYLGPVFTAKRGVPTRLKLYNLLPTGRFDGVNRNGDLFLPVDETFPGAGSGPDVATVSSTDPSVASDGRTRYTQNRVVMHLHGGDNPWISDGTPHQWFTPGGESDATVPGSLANLGAPLADYARGTSNKQVPDMNDPGAGATTYYYPNGQSGRLEWVHDHIIGATRLNVYAGMAAPYVLQDPLQERMLNTTTVAGFPGADATIPLIIQDKGFVPDDIALQDARWNHDKNGNYVPAWGEPGDLWFPHVYETNQDPNSIDGTNPSGRWDWGPWFWPVFPSLYNLPSGAVGDVTATPESWMDTPVVNGVAYPSLTVEPRAYRFMMLNGSNDRVYNLSLFVADSAVSTISVTNGGSSYNPATTKVTLVAVNGGSGATAEPVIVNGVVVGINVNKSGTSYQSAPQVVITDSSGVGTGAKAVANLAVNTEVKMVPAVPVDAQSLPACPVDADGVEATPSPSNKCWPSTWPVDGRAGGVPDPATAGPDILQIANDGGILPKVATIPAMPMGYEYNRRSITVLNTENQGLYIAPAERADIVIDFSKYAGKTLIVYNDSPSPVPAFDPRNDFYTNGPDNSSVGGAESTRAGFGPNTRTIMQIKVGTGAAKPLDVAALSDVVPKVFKATQPLPTVGQSYYNQALGTNFSDVTQADGSKAYAGIYTGSLQEPVFKYTPAYQSGVFNAIDVLKAGDGYIKPPKVAISAPDAPSGTKIQATAEAVLRISKVLMTETGSGYTSVPKFKVGKPANNNVATPVTGDGAAGITALKTVSIAVTNGGSGYSTDPALAPRVTVEAPMLQAPNPSGVTTTAHAVVTNGTITRIVIDNAGEGYDRVPNVTISAPPGHGAGATATADMGVAYVTLTALNPAYPDTVGGGGYNDLSQLVVTIDPPQLRGGVTATAELSGSVFTINMLVQGVGYTKPPTVTLESPATANGQNRPSAQILALYKGAEGSPTGKSEKLVLSKAIQELFEPTYGRMNATFGVELPYTTQLNQTTIPLGYVDPVTERFANDEVQIWKITHNGVDMHPVHIHMLNVQLINRIGWDGTVKPPHDNEYGWKDTVKMNPLEDIVLALRPKTMSLGGFGLPVSVRPADPSQPLGVTSGFTQIDPTNGSPAVTSNQIVDYGWEYVWHCHILGHEDGDFMRPMVFDPNQDAPATATGLTGSRIGTTVNLAWNDTSTTEYKYTVLRTPLVNNVLETGNATSFDLPANTQSFADTGATFIQPGTYEYRYDVTPVGSLKTGTTVSWTTSGQGEVTAAPASVTVLAQRTATTGVGAGSDTVNVNWTAVANATGYNVRYSTNGGQSWMTLSDVASGAATNAVLTLPRGSNALNSAYATYIVEVQAQSLKGPSQWSTPVTVKVQ